MSGDLGDEFAGIGDEVPEVDLTAGLEGWPDGDWEDA